MKQNRKEEKTIQAIYTSLENLILKKDYQSITVSDIIKDSHISRSTFYSHFKSKDDVLKDVCLSIFSHVFSSGLSKEDDHDFSQSSIFDYHHMITHLFYHFRDERELIHAILSSSGSYLFIDILSEKTTKLMKACLYDGILGKSDIPPEIEIRELTSSLIELLKYYTQEERKETPEEMTEYFFKMHH